MDIREIVRHIRANRSNRAVQEATGVDRRAVKQYREWATKQGLLNGPLPTLEELQERVETTLVSTVYLGKLYQHNTATNVVTKHYMFNGQLVAQRTVDGQGGSIVTFLLGDHLGSVTTVLWASGAVKDNQRYNPWGEVRWAQSGNPITGYSYTSQRYDDALGLYDYNARYYDPYLNRFISADTIVPSMSNADSRLTPLTVSFSEPVMIEQQNVENRQLLWFGPSFTWSQRLVQIFELVVPLGPIAPQTLNRYAYTLTLVYPFGRQKKVGQVS